MSLKYDNKFLGPSKVAKTVVVFGVTYPSVTAACKHFMVSKTKYYRFLDEGLTQEQALTTPYKRKKCSSWSDQEEMYLITHCKTLTAGQIALNLKRPKVSIYGKAAALNISLVKEGESHHNSKLTDRQVIMIMSLFDCGFTVIEIQAELFNHISISTLQDIKSMRSRKTSHRLDNCS